jgi:cation diffusion facilitator CzcD-associated flavoprotein CzcO
MPFSTHRREIEMLALQNSEIAEGGLDVDVGIIGAVLPGSAWATASSRRGWKTSSPSSERTVWGAWWWNTYPGCHCDIPSTIDRNGLNTTVRPDFQVKSGRLTRKFDMGAEALPLNRAVPA